MSSRKSNVYLIEGKCFSFDNTNRNKDDTTAYCLSVFGKHLRGRIHEPRSRMQFYQSEINLVVIGLVLMINKAMAV